jgi:hypothetical protein
MANNKADKATELISYKGYPLVRKGNQIYYGNATDENVVMIQIMQSQKLGDVDIATKLKVFRMKTDESLPANEKITKTADKESLYEALEIAHIWLSRASS